MTSNDSSTPWQSLAIDEATADLEPTADCEAALGAIRWTSSPVPWPSARPVLDVAIESLPTVEDDVAADLVEQLAFELEDQHDEVSALRITLSEALSLAHRQHREIERLRDRHHRVIEELRALRQKADA